jgi:hypothetical protein
LRYRQLIKARNYRRRRREQDPPWVLRRFPASKRSTVVMVFTGLGIAATCCSIAAAAFGVLVAPIMIASGHSGSLLEVWMRGYLNWLKARLSKDSYLPAYIMIQCGIGYVIFYFTYVFTWLRDVYLWKSKCDTSDMA